LAYSLLGVYNRGDRSSAINEKGIKSGTTNFYYGNSRYHPEQREGSALCLQNQILRFTQNDRQLLEYYFG
jgi:hypothetical protein